MFGLRNRHSSDKKFSDDFLYFDRSKMDSSGSHIFLACMPKSGSTYLANVLSSISGYKNVQFRLQPADNHLEQDIYLPALIKYKNVNTITQQHTRGVFTNFELLKSVNAYILVLTRNIFDIVISTYDHIENSRSIGSSLAYGNDGYFELNKEQKLQRIVDLVVPWHIHFYVSWCDRFQKENYLKMKWIRYEDLISDEIGFIIRLSSDLQLKSDEQRIIKVVENVKANSSKSRFNMGIKGRGNELSDELRKRIIGYTFFYPEFDFSSIGIESRMHL